jgi:hypothetical protein
LDERTREVAMRIGRAVWIGLVFLGIVSLGLAASTAELYFATDKSGANRVTNVQEGQTVWIAVYDPDENIDCDVRDKFWTDVKIMDPKTGAYIVWVSYEDSTGSPAGQPYDDSEYVPYKGHYPGNSAGWLGADFFEETGADTGLFVSVRAFQIGTREDYDCEVCNTHVVDDGLYPGGTWPNDFQWGGFEYLGSGQRGWFNGVLGTEYGEMGQAFRYLPEWPSEAVGGAGSDTAYLVGRFENMDTLVGMVVDPNDDSDVATAMMKIIDTQATVAWDQQIYKDANGAATITICDADENLNCNLVEYVPVFILVNPGSWNPVDGEPWSGIGGDSPTNFCMLKRTGGVPGNATGVGAEGTTPIRWYDIYNSYLNAYGERGAQDGRYYIQYATEHQTPWNVVWFDTVNADGITAVSFYAQETGVNTGVFQLNLNSILDDLGFNSLDVRDVLVAYYLDPNDEDDFQVSAAYIEEKQHSITSFTDANRVDKEIYWLGRDPVYVQVIDSNANVDPCCPEEVVVLICDPHEEDDVEWIILDETSSNSPVFLTFAGLELLPVWDAMGVGSVVRRGPDGMATRGYQLVLDNWRIEAYNEDHVYAQYNDAYYGAPNIDTGTTQNDVSDGLAGLGDSDTSTSFPPLITQGPVNNVQAGRAIGGSPGIRVPNDVSFDLMEIADTQVYDGSTVNMHFLDRQANRVSGYVNSDCVFIEVVDQDQNEDVLRRERVDGYWDGGQNYPFGPVANRTFGCTMADRTFHPINDLLGDTDIFNVHGYPMVYVLNPRSGFWAALDLLETGVTTGDFVSVICVDLVNVYTCVPTLGTLPGDTIVAFYMDPSNHSDSAMIQIKVGVGGGGTPASQASSTTFVNAAGIPVQSYTDADLVYVKVVDPSHTGAATLSGLTLGGEPYGLTPLAGASTDTFITVGLDLGISAGDALTATYVDSSDPTDTSNDTISIVASQLEVERFYAGPSPAAGPVTFGYVGSGIATVMSVSVYDLAGHLVWTNELANVKEIVWTCGGIANGAYIYTIEATDGTDTFSGKGTMFINR